MAEPPLIEAPRSRWRVVERDRRLVVVDARGSDADPAIPGVPALRGTPVPLLANYAARIACRGASDPDGRPILSTGAAYDRNGPRDILLSDAGIVRLGGAVLAAVGLGLILASLVWLAPPVAVTAIVLAAGALNTGLRPRATRWFDGLGRTLPKASTSAD